ncbi:MAG TPA: mechanosensitive ion channel, partial [Epsilonproteobacteria bacterium]|nr:mechanosensitive ion channel [Campylobacterota bacterium]
MKLFLLLISLLSGGVLLHASTTPESNSTEMIQADSVNEKNMTELPKKQHIVSRMQHIQAEIDQIDSDILEKSVLPKIYSNYNMFQELQKQHSVMEKDISKLQETKRLNFAQKEELEQLIQQRNTLEGKLTLLAEYEKDPFKKFLEPPKIEEVPSVGNPFAIIGAISYQDKLISNQDEYLGRFEKLEDIMDKLEDKEQMVEKLYTLSGGEEKYQTLLYDIREEIKTFQSVMEIFQTTLNVYTKKVEEIKLELSRTITEESKKTAYIGGFLLFLLILLLFVKYLVKRYMSDMDRYYTINKAINLTFFIFVVLTLLFAYIQNVSYLVTILGFASAGIAIAMKDWFMSVMGWFVIVIG